MHVTYWGLAVSPLLDETEGSLRLRPRHSHTSSELSPPLAAPR